MTNLQRPDDVELHLEDRGDGPLVMLAPYWSGHPGVYEGFLSDLERDHRIVTWDARGTGESTRAGPYDAKTDADDLEAVLEEVGKAAAVISVANGCNIAVEVGARRPDLIEAVLAFDEAGVLAEEGGGVLAVDGDLDVALCGGAGEFDLEVEFRAGHDFRAVQRVDRLRHGGRECAQRERE